MTSTPIRHFATLYASFSFAAELHHPTNEDGDERPTELLSVYSIYMDPFNDILWLGRAIRAGEPTLKERLEAAADDSGAVRLTAWLLPRLQEEEAMAFNFHAKISKWNPLDLNAAHDAVAIEWVGLRSGVPPQVHIVPAEEQPEHIRNNAGGAAASNDMVKAAKTKEAIVRAIAEGDKKPAS